MRTDAVVLAKPPRRLAPWQAQSAIQLLSTAIASACPVTKLAEACGLSRSHFAHAFRGTTGVTPHKWLLQHRIRRACEMMEHTDQCLAEIAHGCGFADQSHFSRTFRALMNQSPAVWRRERRSGVTADELTLPTWSFAALGDAR